MRMMRMRIRKVDAAERLRAARVEQCAVAFHRDAVATDQRHVAVQHIVVAVHEAMRSAWRSEVGAAATHLLHHWRRRR